MEKLVTGYIVDKAVQLTVCIVRRALRKAVEGSSSQFGQTLKHVLDATEKDTTKILDGLKSQQRSNVKSAYDYIKRALCELQAWNDEPPTSLETTNRSDELSLSTVTVSALTTSKYFAEAMTKLEKAYEWATLAFNDEVNSTPMVRVEALHIRLFCIALLKFDNGKLCLDESRVALEPFFADRKFVKCAMGKQGFLSMLLSDERAKPVGEKFMQAIKSLENLIWSLVLKDTSLVPDVRDFAQYFQKHLTWAPDVELPLAYSALSTFLIYYDLSEGIELSLRSDRLVIFLREFRAVTPAGNRKMWAIKLDGQLISFDAEEPQTQSQVINDGRRWVSVGYASDLGKIFATAEGEKHICVFHASTAQEIKNEQISLPPGQTLNSAYRMKVTPSGIIFLNDTGNRKGFVLFSDDSSDRKWFELSKYGYDDILQGNNSNEIIGMSMTVSMQSDGKKEYVFVGDVIKKVTQGKKGIVVKAIEERIQFLKEQDGYISLIAVGNQTSLSDCKITLACQTERADRLISWGVKVERGNITGFPVKDEGTDFQIHRSWKAETEMVEAYTKLFICNA